MKIIKYVTFNSSEEFEKWQADKNIGIVSITPIPRDVSISESKSDEKNNTTGTIEVSIFVVYTEIENE